MDVDAVLSDECSATSIDSNEMLGLRIGGMFGILLVSSLGIALPYFTKFERFSTLIFMMKAFAGGVVLATGTTSCRLPPSTSTHCQACHLYHTEQRLGYYKLKVNVVQGSDSNCEED